MRFFWMLTLGALCVCSCAGTGAVKTTIYKDRRMEIALHGPGSDAAASLSESYSHPAAFKVEELKYLLGSIDYREKGLFGWSGVRRVFSAAELYRLTPHLVNAFGRATPGDEVVFSSTAAKTGALFSSTRFTSGRMFIKDKKLHCVFGDINIRYDPEDASAGDPKKEYAGKSLALVTNDWQSLFEDENGTHHNWIEIDYERANAVKARAVREIKRRIPRRRATERKRTRETTGWEDWEPDKAIE